MNRIKCKISDLGKIVGGGTPDTNKLEYYNGNISWITPKDLVANKFRFISRGERMITNLGLENSSAKLIPKNSILFSSRAPIGYIAISENELSTNQGFRSIIPNKEIEYLFLYYLLVYNTEYISSFGAGTTFKEISGSILGSIDVYLPESIDMQKKISYCLDILDRKIELNIKINDNLEQQMKLKYNNLMVKTHKNEVIGQQLLAKDLVDVVTGKEDANFSVEKGKYKFFTCSNEPLTCNEYKFNSSSVLIAGNGDFNVKHYTGKFNAYQRTYVLTPHKDYYALFYLSCVNRIDAFKSKSTGSIVKFITKSDIENIPVFIPDDKNILNRLNKLLSLKEKNTKEIEYLISLRDFLLPLLMNGQATIE